MKVDRGRLMKVYAKVINGGCSSSDGQGALEAVGKEGIGYDNTFVGL